MTNAPIITKKAAHAARVEQSKRDAYAKKVRALVGYAGERLDAATVTAAYEAKKDPILFAAEVVAREPVGAAVWPQKADAVKAASAWAYDKVEKNLAKLEAVDFDANKLAPYPRYAYAHSAEGAAYMAAKHKHANTHAYVTPVSPSDDQQKHNDNDKTRLPCFVARDETKVLRFVSMTEEATADNYNAFICKLVAKIGPDAVSATLEGNHVWSFSILTVTMKDGSVQRWKTQEITNTSCLGLRFPQWPTRLMKGGA